MGESVARYAPAIAAACSATFCSVSGPLAIGGKQDPVRLVFTAASGKAVNASVVELANRFRMIVDPVTLMPPEHPLPALPVARAVWVPEPNLKIAATAWILAGGSHHTALSPALTPEHLENFAAMAGMEYLLIDADTKLADFTRELRWNDLYYQQILHHRFELAIVEEVAHCQSAADLRNLDGRSSQLANVGKRSIPLIQKQQLGLKVLEPGMKAVDLGIYMSVDQEKILPAIVVEIDKRISPPHIASGALRNSRSNRDIGKSQVPVIAIEGGILVVKVRNQQRHAPSMQKVAQGNSHIGLGSAVGVERHTGRKTDIHEFFRAIPPIKIGRLAVVCDQKIQFAVMVKVRPDRRQAIAVLRITHARFLGNISEGSIPVVVVQIVRRSLQAARAALHIDAQVFAGVARTECRHIVQAKIHLVRDEEVVPAVAVIISKGCSRGPLGVAAQPGAFGHVGKGVIAIVAIELHPTKTGHQQVRPPVVVVVP